MIPMRNFRPRELAKFRGRLLTWFRKHRRDLPWRASRSPYRIWVAEVMLQQTRIAAVLPYYHRFLHRFPSIELLARASQGDVLRLWSGLGYYSRARNLHRAAQEIISHHGGEFPRESEAALNLPGIGRYTAAAVLSIAHNAPLAVLDGNVARVLARLGAIRGNLRDSRRWHELEEIAQHFLAAEAPGDWNQALMELGETICRPRSPRCDACVVSRWCCARKLGVTREIPSRRRKPTVVKVRIAAAVLRDPRGRTLLLRDRGAHDAALFSRLWQFPAIEVARQTKAELARHVAATLGIKPPWLEALPRARHGVTFRNIALLPFLARVARLPSRARTCIVPLDRIGRLPISSATRKIAEAAAAVH
jgi:A/G-specific adenine glycosylase